MHIDGTDGELIKLGVFLFASSKNEPSFVQLLDANDAACKLLDYDRTNLMSLSPADYCDVSGIVRAFREAYTLKIFREYRLSWTLTKRTNEKLSIEAVARTIECDRGTLLIACVGGTTGEEQTQQLLAENERFNALLHYSTEVFAIVNEYGMFNFVSDAVQNVLGYDPNIRIGQDFCDNAHPDDIPWMRRFLANVLKTRNKPITIEVRIRTSDNVWRDFEITARNLCHEPTVRGMVLNYRDITERKNTQRLLNDLANKDPLTKIRNRQAFAEHFESQLVVANLLGKKLALLYIGLDRFSYINDTFGHSMGDRLLQMVSARLSGSLQQDAMLARVGGDEFTVLITNLVDIVDSTTVAKAIIQALEPPFELDGYEIYVTVSIGISTFPEDGIDAGALMQHADIALSRAKALGKNQFQVFTPTMNVETYKNFVIQNDLRKAILKDELSVAYQPRVQTSTGKIVSAEALIRWKHPEWGNISPKDFIPIAEQTGLIVQLGEWVLRTVCQQNKAWQSEGLLKIPISVNMSAIQFSKKDMLDTIKEILLETGLDGQWLEIEVTEGALVENEDLLIHAIQALQEIGVQAAIDDFGTGYSSLSRLKNSKMNTLKIDKSFVQNANQDVPNATITQAIIQMGHGLGMTVVAEGVETVAELTFLAQHGCDQIQGYIFSRPLPAGEFRRVLQKQKISVQKLEPSENRRRYFRMTFPYPLLAQMTITSIHGKSVALGNTRVLIEDIGPGGLRFLSNIRLPINSDVTLRFHTKIFEDLCVYGNMVWNSETNHDIQEYGVEFLLDATEESELTKQLNQLAVALRQDTRRALTQCEFYQGDKGQFFKGNS